MLKNPILILGLALVVGCSEGDEGLAPTPVSSYSSIRVGSSHTCGLKSGAMRCWGANTDGQLGDFTTSDRGLPIQVYGLVAHATALTTGANHSCAVVYGGLKCWGKNNSGQLGNGTTANRLVPVDTGLPEGSEVISVQSGTEFSCALSAGGSLKCWGKNNVGQVGNGGGASLSPVEILTGVHAFALGDTHGCALVGRGIKCWGGNGAGQLGDGTTANSMVPIDVLGVGAGTEVQALAAGSTHSCALVNQVLKCWGDNTSGQLGNGNTTSQVAPVEVVGATSVREVVAGNQTTCLVTKAGGAKCWGLNDKGQIGNGNTTNQWVAADVSGLGSGVQALAAAFSGHACALVSGTARCWGNNDRGQLGDGTTTNRSTPIVVSGF